MSFGETVFVVGEWSGWDVEKAVGMTWTKDNVWEASVPAVTIGNQYKYVVKAGKSLMCWEDGKNHTVLENPPTDVDEWGKGF